MTEDNSYESIQEIFTEYLKKHKHRKTSERYAILKHIYSSEGHFDAETLFNQMKENYRVSLATVYNTLDLLLDARLLVRHQLGGQVAQYEKTLGSKTHHHLVCTSCGKVKEFSDKQIRTSIQNREFASFQVAHYSLYLYGICRKCEAGKKIANNK